ncbi:MAG: dephospho-CoA kinase [Candidatus Eisenbacteria bacterium]|jgi:dephospho-CoA kinase|nr:dephospho-CoA kinase [Candidatus Eisenbacteria bacterium]
MRSSACLIGVTGLPGSGKTAFSSRLAARGARVVSADAVGHQVLAERAVQRMLAQTFGAGILDSAGEVDRQALRAHLADVKEVDSLNRIVHPRLLSRLAQAVGAAMRGPGPVVAVDAALLLEWHIEQYFDLVVLVVSPSELRYRRLTAAGRDLPVIEVLEQSQLREAEKRERSHFIVDNTTSIERLERSADALFAALTRGACKETTCPRRLWSD